MNRINIQNYAESFVESYQFQKYVDESYWEGDFNTEYALRLMEMRAYENGIQLMNTDSFDYDTFFQEAFNNMEKGLS